MNAQNEQPITPQPPQPRTSFIWPVYADATLAGLSVLFPIPILDIVLQAYFRRRMPTAIARYHQQALPPTTRHLLATSREVWFTSCLMFVLALPVMLIKRLSRKIFYVLTVNEAAEALSYYWQRAFLLNYIIEAQHVQNDEQAEHARHAMEQAISTSPSPLMMLSGEIVHSMKFIVMLLLLALRGKPKTMWSEAQERFRQRWGAYDTFLRDLAAKYTGIYQERFATEDRHRLTDSQPPADEQ